MRLRRRPSRSPSPPPPPRPRAWADVAASLVAARRSYSDLATASDAAVTAAKGAAKDAGVALRAAAADAAAAARAEHERVSAALRAAADRAAASPSGLEGFDRVLALAQASMSGGGVAGDGGERARVGAPSRARRGAGPRGPRRARTALTPPAADDLWSVLDSTLGLKSGGGGRGKAGGTPLPPLVDLTAAAARAAAARVEDATDALSSNWASLGAAARRVAAGAADAARATAPPPRFLDGDRFLTDLPPPLAAAAAALASSSRKRADAAAARKTAAPFAPDGPLQRETARRRAAAGSSLRSPGRKVAIFTTASLPWMTGTAVNPLLRAAHLAADDATRKVTLYVPWLPRCDQDALFPASSPRFDTPAAQAAWVREWARKRTRLPCDFGIDFYAARYAPEKGSILPVGDPTSRVPPSDADVAVLEEPEHLTWYHHGARWADAFAHVVGVVHTNYLDYAARETHGSAKAAALRLVNGALVRAHTHKVVKLSDAVQALPRSTTEFVHGVPAAFLEVGAARAAAIAKAHGGAREDGGGDASPAPPATPRPASSAFGRGAYFIGKAVWAKGYTELLDLVEADAGAAAGGDDDGERAAAAATRRRRRRASSPSSSFPLPTVDCYGGGADLADLRAAASARRLPLAFHGPRDHLDARLHDYRVLVNPSTSDVVATTTAEALAMGKWVVVADLPCNAWFGARFRNCLRYRTRDEFSKALRHALAHDPHPVSSDEAAALSWEAATQRFLDAAELAPGERPTGPAAAADRAIYAAHNALTSVETLRAAVGAGTGTRDAPPCLEVWTPPPVGEGGLFDRRPGDGGAGAPPAMAMAMAKRAVRWPLARA